MKRIRRRWKLVFDWRSSSEFHGFAEQKESPGILFSTIFLHLGVFRDIQLMGCSPLTSNLYWNEITKPDTRRHFFVLMMFNKFVIFIILKQRRIVCIRLFNVISIIVVYLLRMQSRRMDRGVKLDDKSHKRKLRLRYIPKFMHNYFLIFDMGIESRVQGNESKIQIIILSSILPLLKK